MRMSRLTRLVVGAAVAAAALVVPATSAQAAPMTCSAWSSIDSMWMPWVQAIACLEYSGTSKRAQYWVTNSQSFGAVTINKLEVGTSVEGWPIQCLNAPMNLQPGNTLHCESPWVTDTNAWADWAYGDLNFVNTMTPYADWSMKISPTL
ncbi:hypothetical protein ACFFSW_17040 [Saccharothrix longispora]|uniref:Secreted protein n=1 Tax=Saccharothrix longispora TaxID=33920 RepID=A0ABU1PSM8_9PSEU|nr:hypothetical protein [Saccharothrix longispora]MDR6593652.1 hypothetical protein [Saccharothrix longispora]